jgi:hypothetical protein
LQPLGNEIQLLSTFWLVSVPAWPNDIGDRTMTMGIARLLLTSCFVLVLVPFAFAADDPFAEGSTWSGERYNAKSSVISTWELRIIKRDGSRFEGEITIIRGKKSSAYKVTGKASNRAEGDVTMTNVKTGFFEQTFTGKLKKGEILFVCVGTDEGGKAFTGTGTLKLRK